MNEIKIGKTLIKNCVEHSSAFDASYAGDLNPWGQKKGNISDEYDFLTSHVSRKFDCVCDIGCGLGYSLSDFNDKLMLGKVIGLDVSQNCINRAKKLFPSFQFYQYNLTVEQDYKKAWGGNCLYLFRGVLWYVGLSAYTVAENIAKLAEKDDILLINQPFSSYHIEWDSDPNCNIIKELFDKYFEISGERFIESGNSYHYTGVLKRK